jgi:RNA polymerase sigma factor (sigma-70 family)
MMRVEMEAVRVEGNPLAELYRLHIDEAFRLGYLLTGDRALGEDLAQDAFVRLAGCLLHLRRPGDFSAYLRRTVVNLAMSQFRRRRVEQRYLRRLAAIRQPEAPELDVATQDQLQIALLELPPRQRTAVVLRFYLDLTDAKAGDLIDGSEIAFFSARGDHRGIFVMNPDGSGQTWVGPFPTIAPRVVWRITGG